jgi:hypothetical protein
MRIMKNYKIIILIGVGLFTMALSCKKSENFPVEKVSSAYVFDVRDSDGAAALKYLYNVYQVVKIGHNRVDGNYLDAAGDDAVSSLTGSQVGILATGGYSAVDFPAAENVWELNGDTYTINSFWSGIRYANEFINNIGVVPVKGSFNGIGTRYIWRNEARFLRAYFYFELVKRYGGVPLIGNKVFNINDNLSLPRNSFADCINYIVSECDAVKDSLITAYPLPSAASDNYRATKGAALALKAKVLLYAASPLYNSATNSDPLVGYTDYSAARWTQAANAAGAVINLGTYKLDSVFKNVFLTQNDEEIIFMRPNNSGHDIESKNAPPGFSAAIGSGVTSPTQELVDAFPMANGKPITDPTSGYNPNNPYVGRDPRFAATILYNGAPWLGTNLETFNGGQSKPDNGQEETLTGYYMRKFMGNQENVSQFADHNEDWIVIRYAEVLLDYAEAKNEAVGPVDSVYAALRLLRARPGAAGIDLSNTYGIPAGMSQSDMRTLIQNERRIELAFEEQRFFDIRRWKIAETVMNQPLMGVSIQNSAGVLTYNYIPVLIPKFIAPKMYVYPIPYQEVLKNPNMKQNAGW